MVMGFDGFPCGKEPINEDPDFPFMILSDIGS